MKKAATARKAAAAGKPAAAKPRLSKVGYVILYVKDVRESIPFYRDVLGIPVRHADGGWAELETAGTTLALHGCGEGPPPLPETAPGVVFTVDDIRASHAALAAAGARPGRLHRVCAYDGKVGLSTDFKDPDGNPLSVYGMVPEGEWKE
ncbi:MAG: VOC family protein [Planctomycetaceae bacterium]|nr:VOC family protein [Planctomycetota bacterium]NUN51615.1 VOC family protein [Planctomycetaceae bacterium]